MEKTNSTSRKPDVVLVSPLSSIPPINMINLIKKNRRTSLQRRCGSLGGIMYEERHMFSSSTNIHWC
jgi:hypothetical protein